MDQKRRRKHYHCPLSILSLCSSSLSFFVVIKSFEGSSMDSLGSSQGPKVVSTILDQDNIGMIKKAYQILARSGLKSRVSLAGLS